ncbi:MAG: hypothetical protein ACFFDN_15995 [Candidatus Hodarchaeota archaeon]
MPENNKAFALGLGMLILSVVSLFIWTNNSSFFHNLYIIGAILFCVSGVLFLVGGIKNHLDVVGTGFGLGLPAWGLIIITSYIGLRWNLANLAIVDFNYFVWLWHLNELFKNVDPEIDPWGFYYNLDFLLFMMPDHRPYNIGYIGAIIHIPLAIGGFIFGLLALHSVRKRGW